MEEISEIRKCVTVYRLEILANGIKNYNSKSGGNPTLSQLDRYSEFQLPSSWRSDRKSSLRSSLRVRRVPTDHEDMTKSQDVARLTDMTEFTMYEFCMSVSTATL